MLAPGARKWWITLACHPGGWYMLVATMTLACFPRSASFGVLSGWLAGYGMWLWLALLAPALGGTLVTLVARRFWAWPYVYLVALWLAPATPTRDYIDLGMLVANATLLMICIVLAESLGLSFGHWFSRIFAVGYFLAAGLSLLVLSLVRMFMDPPGWQATFYLVCSVLYFAQGLLQYHYFTLSRLSRQTEPPRPSPPEPVAGAEYLPWTIQVDGRNHHSGSEQMDELPAGENDQNRVR